MDGYEGLRDAIILSAVKDYRKALKKLKKNPDNDAAWGAAIGCELFFKSKWFSRLTPVDGVWLMEKLKKEEMA